MISNIFSITNSENKKHKIITILGVKIKLQNPKFNNFRRERLIISKTIFWDPEWYKEKYNHKNLTNAKALEYWYKKGWYEGESPSKYINVEYCKNCTKGINPIIAYLDKNLNFYVDNKNNYKDEADADRIKEYLEYKNTRKPQGVVYTCITNDYDDLREIEIYKYIDKDWDYVCFTDNQEHINLGHIGIWEVRPLQFDELDSTRNNRYHKLNPHLLFPQYDQSIYVDSNINILTPYFFDEIKRRNLTLLLPSHYARCCIYQEYSVVLEAGLDNKDLILEELNLLKRNSMPQNYGMLENNLIYRKHNDPKVVTIDTEWWQMVKRYSKRDQLSLVYILFKHNINPLDLSIENTRLDVENFYVFEHKKGRK